jgi:hypothetical protein
MAPCPTQRPASNPSAGSGLVRSQIKVMADSKAGGEIYMARRFAWQEMGKPDPGGGEPDKTGLLSGVALGGS